MYTGPASASSARGAVTAEAEGKGSLNVCVKWIKDSLEEKFICATGFSGSLLEPILYQDGQ